MGIEWLKPAAFIGSIVYALIGVIIFWLCFVIIDKITPYNLWEEIVVKQNRALALSRAPEIDDEALLRQRRHRDRETFDNLAPDVLDEGAGCVRVKVILGRALVHLPG